MGRTPFAGGAMIDLDVTHDIREAERWLSRVERRQVPFAAMLALNDTAFDVRRVIVERTFMRDFQVRNRRFPGVAFRVKKATKKRLASAVFDRLGRASLGLHAKGGTKRPKGQHLAVPQSRIARTARGQVRKAQRPRAILEKAGVFKRRLGSGGQGIFRRAKDGRVELLYALTPRARIRRRFRFFEDAERVAKRRFPINFRKGLKRAIATAR